MPDRIVTINSRKYDGHIRRSWKGGLIHSDKDLLILVGTFSEDIEHNDLGHIKKGTVSFEHFWLELWYNIFRFHAPEGTLMAHYANITMPPTFAENVIDYVDLDIDVVVWPDGRVVVLDRDDFEHNKIKYSYPDEVIQQAENGLSEVLAIIKADGLP